MATDALRYHHEFDLDDDGSSTFGGWDISAHTYGREKYVEVIGVEKSEFQILEFKRQRATNPDPDVNTFEDLFNKWSEETEFASSVEEFVLNKNYQRIIGLGPRAIPLLLKKLRKTKAHLFWALENITGENPVPPDEWGNIDAMTKRWILWGNQTGYVQDVQG